MDSIGTTSETYYHIPIDNIDHETWFSVKLLLKVELRGLEL